MKAPIFSAYARNPAALAATLDQLASSPLPSDCPDCHGAGCQHDGPPGQPMRGRDLYECPTCEGTGQVPPPLTHLPA